MRWFLGACGLFARSGTSKTDAGQTMVGLFSTMDLDKQRTPPT